MDIILYFISNPPDLTSVLLLFGVYLIFEVLGEIIAEFLARPVFDKLRPDQKIKKVHVLRNGVSRTFEGDDLNVKISRRGYLKVRDWKNVLYVAPPAEWTGWEKLE